ncbi:adapter-related protein complex 3 beta 2 subunit [Plasmodium cynomolgi strain B]|uniref:Adapter-related protein complex 3 beta 2 subunit n=1 Tax=Plasmodium cynomolgi (strain B) TaxID=1120755 RepID=K6UDY6_PLACD|nr:adapter-related protein complex 3 beta 2 subunit [Plasmodium cynomolgi strain B]GAB67416.1 adapter-related protein complex 3 beta 2 subunit [Plasmodium cynomolgi strain B]
MDSINFNIKVPLLEKAATNVKDIISHIRLNDGIYFDRSKYNKEEITNDLRSNNVQKKIQGVKRLLIAHSMKEDVSEFYVEVLNNLSNKNRTLKKLIYNYLSLYGDRNADLSMLTVNSFKKDILSNDFQIRAYALRAMCCCRSLEMINIVMDSLKIMAKDRSPYVRKTAADVIPSIYNVDPDRYLLIMHPFHQTYLIDLLLLYCRVFYRDPLTNNNINFKELFRVFGYLDGGDTEEGGEEAEESSPSRVIPDKGEKWKHRPGEDSPNVQCIPRNGTGTSRRRSPSPYHSHYCTGDEWDDEWDDEQEQQQQQQQPQQQRRYGVDIELFIKKLLLLLSSCSYNVVIQSISSLYHLTKFTFKESMIQAIISCIMKCSMEGNDHMYALFIRSVQSIIIHLRQDFAAYLSFFYISALDSTVKKKIKIDMLYILSNEENRPIVLEELLHALFQPGNEDLIVKKLFRHITAVAVVDSSCLSTVMQHIIALLNSSLELYSYEAILSLRQLLRQSDVERISQINFFLTRIFFTIESTEVQASVLWTLAKYQNFMDHLLLFDFARMLVKRFEHMEGALKVHVLHFVLKVWAYQYAIWFLHGRGAAGEGQNGNAAGEKQNGEGTGEKRVWERPAATTSIYQEQHSKLAQGTNNHVVHMAQHLEDFAKYERLCKLALLQGSRPEERFDIQETSKFYANIMLRIRELANKGDLNVTFWQRDLYREAVNEYTLPLCYLKHVFLNTGNGDPSGVLRLSREEMQRVRNSPVGAAQGVEHDGYGDYHFDLDHNCNGSGNRSGDLDGNLDYGDGDVQVDLKNPAVLQLNTMSSILNRRLPSYVELPDFADEDLPRSAHMTNRKKTKQPLTSISSRDVQISYTAHLSSNQIFSDVDDFYREEGNLVDRQTGYTQNTLRNAHKQMLHPTSGLLTNRGTKIQGEDDESDDEQNGGPPKVGDSADTYLGECISATNFSKIDEQQINDIEKFFFSDDEDFEGAE